MRITILANRDLASCLALNRLLPALQQQQQHVDLSVFLSSAVGSKKSSAAVPDGLKQLNFFEQKLFTDAIFFRSWTAQRIITADLLQQLLLLTSC